MLNLHEMFDECVTSRYPQLPKDSRQWKELKIMFFYGALASGAIQNEALASPSTSSGFDVDALAKRTLELKAEIDDFLNPKVVVSQKPSLII